MEIYMVSFIRYVTSFFHKGAWSITCIKLGDLKNRQIILMYEQTQLPLPHWWHCMTVTNIENKAQLIANRDMIG